MGGAALATPLAGARCTMQLGRLGGNNALRTSGSQFVARPTRSRRACRGGQSAVALAAQVSQLTLHFCSAVAAGRWPACTTFFSSSTTPRFVRRPGPSTLQESDFSAFDRVSVLSESMPYLQRFRGKTIVIKYGGAAMKDPTLKARVVTDLVLLSTVGIRPVMVHGGGPEINIWLTKLGIEPVFKNGLRVTDGELRPALPRWNAAYRATPRGAATRTQHLERAT